MMKSKKLNNATTRQAAFINSYLANGFNATQAAITAGYSTKTAKQQGSRLLTNVDVKAAIDAKIKEMAMSADEALFRLSEHARGTMADFVDVEKEQIDLAKADRAGRLHLIKEFSHVITPESERITIKLYDAQTALAQIIKEQHLRAGEATERTDVTTLSDDERLTRMVALMKNAEMREAQGKPPTDDVDG